MAITVTATRPFATKKITTTGGVWDRVTVPEWVRKVEVVNDTGNVCAIYFNAGGYADAAPYDVADDQVPVQVSGSVVIDLSRGASTALYLTFSIRTPTAVSPKLILRMAR